MEAPAVEFPFKSVLSFAPLVGFLEQQLAEGRSDDAGDIRKALRNVPELLEPIEDLAVLEKHRAVVEMVMNFVFPPAFRDEDCAAAFAPFHFQKVYATPAFDRLMSPDCQGLGARSNIDMIKWQWGRFMKANLLILSAHYGMDLTFDYPVTITATDPETGLDRHFKIFMDPKFVEVKKVGKPRPLSERDRKRLLENIAEPDIWMELLPPQDYEFHGLGIFRAVDVTDQEVLSSLKRDLIEKESIFSQTGFELLKQKLGTFLGKPVDDVGLAAIKGEEILIFSPHQRLEKGCINMDSMHCRKCDCEGSIYAQAVESEEWVIIEDLQSYPNRTMLEDHLLESGVRSVFVAPLRYGDRLLGTLDLKSAQPGTFTMLNTLKLLEIIPLFSMALNRGMEELDHRVQGVIKEKCTAIHPSVEWRFQQAALNYLRKQDEIPSELEPIVFRNVYALYGVSDIRGSSEHRNEAIQSDLAEHLGMAREIIDLANKHRPLPILQALSYQIDKNVRQVKEGLDSGDDVVRLEFIRNAVEPLFSHIQEFDSEVGDKIRAYRAALDLTIGTLYKRRKAFEESITRINEAIAAYLDKEEETAQGFFPHYFEKLKTDGVDHTIYIGASMVEDGKFDLLYLRNLRLWQLMVMCGVVRLTEELKDSLAVPLETTHLVLVQNAPLSIRFRPDERRFDVDGAYDTRHEIIKKRIDKAMLKGKPERLTQPGKIAVVYSHRREALEYMEYIDYLRASKSLEGEPEHLELQDLQGVHGLKAIRVAVDRQASAAGEHVRLREVEKAVRSL
jgi:putative methionine-R-sulfoxide reductase with GAF domain